MSRNAPEELNILQPLEVIAKTSPMLLGRVLAELDVLAGLAGLGGLPGELSAQVLARRREALEFAGKYTRYQVDDLERGYNALKALYVMQSPLADFDRSQLPTKRLTIVTNP